MKGKSATLKAKEAFMELYQAGRFPPHSKLPSENDMSKTLGISRETWRKVLRVLRSEGILVSRHGSGTYVLPRSNRISNDLSQLQSMTKMIADAGIQELESKTSCRVDLAPVEVCEFFQVPEDTEFFILHKTRYADFGVICTCVNYLPVRFAEGLNEEHIPASLFQHLEKNYSLKMTQAYATLFIPNKKDPLRAALDLPEGKEAFAFKQQQTDARGNPILFSYDYLRSDVFRFSVLRTAL
ncbi:MAG: GntR family transcriptional regulator [Lachnospiraceae bacterium]|nr:GntR family transcriptional regulator [Lachnospiraceae bacterium]